MSSTSKFTMLGEHFAREFVLGTSDTISKDSLKLYRINPISLGKTDDSSNNENLTPVSLHIKNRQELVLKKNIKMFQNIIDQNVSYLEYCFSAITKIEKGEIFVKDIQPEKIITSKKGIRLLKNLKVDVNSLLDSLYLSPVIPESKESWEINNKLFSIFSERLHDSTDVIVISGEMIWSGWASLSSILKLVEYSKLGRKLIIIDNWGYLQQLFSQESKKSLEHDESLRNNLEKLTTSIFVETNKKISEYRNQIEVNPKALETGLFANTTYSRTMQNGFEHKPDYLYFPRNKKKGNKVNHVLDIPLGIQPTSIKPLRALLLGRSNLPLCLPYETLIQKSVGENVEYGEDIGQYPLTESFLLALKFANRFKQSVKNWQLMNAGDVIGEKKVLKNFLTEKVVAPVKGRIDNRYLPWGMLAFNSVVGMSTFRAPFEGKLIGTKKVNNYREIKVFAENITIPLTYTKGPEVAGKILSIEDFKTEADGEKIVLLRKADLEQVNKEDIVKYNIVGFVLLDADYQTVKKFTKDFLHDSKNITVSLIHPLSNSSFGTMTDIVYLMSGRMVVILEKKIHILIDKRSKKEIYLRLNSGKDSSHEMTLKKGDHVYYLNYKHNNMYARIEKVEAENVLLMRDDEVVQAKAINIIKYSTTEIYE
jgi:hypothetical protein